MAMPAARGLFQRAWTMSGQQVTAAGPRAAAQRAAIAMEAVGAKDLSALLRLPATDLLAATRARDPSRVESTSLYFGPVLDEVSLPVHPFWPQAPRQSASIPMVIGNTRDETRAFLGNDPANFTLTWETLPAQLQRQQFVDLLPQTVIAEYRRLYPHYTPSEVFFAATTAGRSWRGAVEELEARARPAGRAHLGLPAGLGLTGGARPAARLPHAGHPAGVRQRRPARRTHRWRRGRAHAGGDNERRTDRLRAQRRPQSSRNAAMAPTRCPGGRPCCSIARAAWWTILVPANVRCMQKYRSCSAARSDDTAVQTFC